MDCRQIPSQDRPVNRRLAEKRMQLLKMATLQLLTEKRMKVPSRDQSFGLELQQPDFHLLCTLEPVPMEQLLVVILRLLWVLLPEWWTLLLYTCPTVLLRALLLLVLRTLWLEVRERVQWLQDRWLEQFAQMVVQRVTRRE